MICLFISFLFPSSSFAVEAEVLQRKVFGKYRVMVKWHEQLDCQEIVIVKSGRIVFSECELGHHYWIGNNFNDSVKGKDFYSGKDFTGNGIPDLLISQWTGGAHCCNIVHVFEMDKTALRKLSSIDGGSYGFEIKDFDGDKIPEISFWDWPIDYLFNSFSHSAQAKVVLKYIGNEYHVASSLMYKNRPAHKNLEKLKNDIRKNFDREGDRVPYELLDIMMELSYSGYKELAMRIANETWPIKRTDFKKFRREFKEALSDSIYWSEFNIGKY